jgi:hypothetical protein
MFQEACEMELRFRDETRVQRQRRCMKKADSASREMREISPMFCTRPSVIFVRPQKREK